MPSPVRLPLLLLIAGALAAADPVLGPGSSTVTVNEITMQRAVRYPSGKVDKAEMDQHLQVSMAWKADPALVPTGQVRRVCDTAVTDAGEDIAAVQIDPREFMSRRFRSRRPLRMAGKMDQPSWEILKLAYPTRPARSLSVSGALLVTCETRAGEAIDIAAGEPVAVQGQAVTLAEDQKPGDAKLSYPDAFEERVRNIQFLDAAGTEIVNTGFNGTSEKGMMVKTYHFPNGAVAAKVRITLVGDEVEVRIPFSFKDLPLEAPPAKGRGLTGRPVLPPAAAPAPAAPPVSGF